MRYMGIDYGTKRIGLALSDEAGRLSFPLSVIDREGVGHEEIGARIIALATEKGAGAFVVGASQNMDMKDNSIMPEIRAFAEVLKEKSGMEVFFEQEFLTSFVAEKSLHELSGNTAMLDASAAALILQSYIDRINA